MGVLKVWDGTAWQFISASSDGASVYVGPSAPPGTPDTGDMWFDSDEDGTTGTTLPLRVADGGTGATNAATARTNLGLTLPLDTASGGTGGTSVAAARTNLAVPAVGQSGSVVGAPTSGTWARGDQWLDSANVTWTCITAGTPGTWVPPVGYELLYAQITANVALSNTTAAGGHLVVDGGTRTYDGSSVMAEFFADRITPAANAGSEILIHLWDGATDLGRWAEVANPAAGAFSVSVHLRRKITPTAGSHNYLVKAWVWGSPGTLIAGTGGPDLHVPAYLRITRA